jgi:hypothetical protein
MVVVIMCEEVATDVSMVVVIMCEEVATDVSMVVVCVAMGLGLEATD